MAFIEKELLIGRVQYLEKINTKPGQSIVNKDIVQKVKSMIEEGSLVTFMQVEAVFNHLMEHANNSPEKIETSASEILEFIS
ncbi:MAG: hypothetical protein ABFS32_18375 [Bacteroidota bacterium]